LNNFKEYACEICGTACNKPAGNTYKCVACNNTGHFKRISIEELEKLADALIFDMGHNEGTIFDLEKQNELIKKKLKYMGSDGEINNE
jgi:hypothetical protein